MAEIHFHEVQEYFVESLEEVQGLCNEEGIIALLGIPTELSEDAIEIICSLYESAEGNVAFAYLDGVAYARIFDGEKYLFPCRLCLQTTPTQRARAPILDIMQGAR